MFLQQKTCLCCGNLFTKKRLKDKASWQQQKYCSTKCKKLSQIGKLRASVLTKICKQCQKEFQNRRKSGRVIEPYKWVTTKFCSVECKNKSQEGIPLPGVTEATRRGANRIRRDVAERFWEKVDKSEGPDSCWEWQAYRNEAGYGQFQLEGTKQQAHRVAWFLVNGLIPEGVGYHGFVVRHSCDNPPCVNPNHLSLGTQYLNMQDREERKRRSPIVGEEHGMSKLSKDEVRDIRDLYETGRYKQKRLATLFDVSRAMISNVITRRNWKHID